MVQNWNKLFLRLIHHVVFRMEENIRLKCKYGKIKLFTLSRMRHSKLSIPLVKTLGYEA